MTLRVDDDPNWVHNSTFIHDICVMPVTFYLGVQLYQQITFYAD